MLAELGCHSIPTKEAALRLALQRAKRILETGEDPLSSIPYFHQLMLAADYPDELIESAISMTMTSSSPTFLRRNRRVPARP